MDRLRRLVALLASAGCLVTTSAWAQTADEHAAAQSIIAEVQGKPRASASSDAVRQAKDALERATRLRVAGDEAHAKAADGVALEWAQTARDVANAAGAEASAAELRKKALEAQAQLDRSRALVEEIIASIGRLRAELEQVGAAPKAAHLAVEVHDGDPLPKNNGSSRKPPTSAPKNVGKPDVGGTP